MKAQLLIKIIERNPTLTVEGLAELISNKYWHQKIYNFEIYHFADIFGGYDEYHFTYYLHRRGYTGRDIARMLYVSEKVVSQRLMKVRTNKDKYDLKLIENMLYNITF